MKCPRCSAELAPAELDWLQCRDCGYEATEEAYRQFRDLSAKFEADAEKFFARVQHRLDDLRALEPVWQMHR